MTFKFDIGDRIRLSSYYCVGYGVIVDSVGDYYNTRYQIEYNNVPNIIGSTVELWHYEDDIELDTEFYRGEKLKSLLKEAEINEE